MAGSDSRPARACLALCSRDSLSRRAMNRAGHRDSRRYLNSRGGGLHQKSQAGYSESRADRIMGVRADEPGRCVYCIFCHSLCNGLAGIMSVEPQPLQRPVRRRSLQLLSSVHSLTSVSPQLAATARRPSARPCGWAVKNAADHLLSSMDHRSAFKPLTADRPGIRR